MSTPKSDQLDMLADKISKDETIASRPEHLTLRGQISESFVDCD